MDTHNEGEDSFDDETFEDIVVAATSAATAAAFIYAEPLFNKIPYHTSSFFGLGWVCELINGHPDCIRCELGVHKDVFQGLISQLLKLGHGDSQHITLEEQLAIFLYMCVTGLSVQHIGEQF